MSMGDWVLHFYDHLPVKLLCVLGGACTVITIFLNSSSCVWGGGVHFSQTFSWMCSNVGPQHDMPKPTSDFKLYTHSWWKNQRWILANQVTGACRLCAARFTRSARCLSVCPRCHRFVCKAFCTFCALSLCMSLVTTCMCCAFCTTAEDDADAWDAHMDTSDVDMFTHFSEAEGEGEVEGWGEGEGWPDRHEARGRQMSQPLFFHPPHPHRTSNSVHAADTTVVAALA